MTAGGYRIRLDLRSTVLTLAISSRIPKGLIR